MRLSRAVFNLEKVLLIRVWKISNPQCPISKLASLLYFRDSCNASTKYAWAKQCEISSRCDSREARFELWRFDFTQKATCLSKAWWSANWIWKVFEPISWINCMCQIFLCTRTLKVCFQSKSYFCLGSRRTESLIWSASNQCLELTVSIFFSVRFSTLEVPDWSFEGLISVKKWLLCR